MSPPPPAPESDVLRVALPVPLPRLFDYAVGTLDSSAIAIGSRVSVPFGSRELVGVVAGIGAGETPAELRPATALLDPRPLFAGELLE